MVLHCRKNNLVSRQNVGIAPGIGDQINRFSCAAGEDNFVGVLCVNELANGFTNGFIGVSRFFSQSVNASVNVGVVAFVIAGERVDDCAWLLRCGGVVQVDKLFSLNLALQNWKNLYGFVRRLICS